MTIRIQFFVDHQCKQAGCEQEDRRKWLQGRKHPHAAKKSSYTPKQHTKAQRFYSVLIFVIPTCFIALYAFYSDYNLKVPCVGFRGDLLAEM